MFWKENILNMLSSTVLNTIDSCQFQIDGDQWKYAEITDTSEIDGKYVIATNGTTKKVTMNWLIKTVLHGKAGRKNQANWWKGTAHGAGYVIVKRA